MSRNRVFTPYLGVASSLTLTEVTQLQTRKVGIQALSGRPARVAGVPSNGTSKKPEGSQIVRKVNEDGLGAQQPEQVKVSVEFMLRVEGAESVAIAGSFNDWNPKQTPMRRTGDMWQARMELPRGRYEYRFVVDGKWSSDPNAKECAANPFGSSNSVLNV